MSELIIKKFKNNYDLNLLLGIANVFVCGFCIFLYNIGDYSGPVNFVTLVLIALFAAENIGMLLYEKRRRNPFIIILVLLMTVFYMLRAATLIISPSSAEMFSAPSMTAEDLNYTLIFILFSNASMFLGFHFGSNKNVIRNNILYEDSHAPKIGNAIIIIALLGLVNFSNVLSPELFGRLSGFISGIFFNQGIILLFTFTMLVYHYDKISQKLLFLFIVIILCMIFLMTLSGSRSGFLTAGIAMLMGVLAVKQRVMINKKMILICLILIPLAMILFITATFKRQLGIKDTISVEHLYMAEEHQIFSSERMEVYLNLIYYRLGFLDWSTELIADRKKFERVINGKYYLESIIDNVLTPGFDLFDTAKASNALGYARSGHPIPYKFQIADFYQSDQMGIYGEYYVLFHGYPALLAFFFLSFAFQRASATLKTKSALLACLYKAVLLNLFYIAMNSFGMDWFTLDITTTLITTFLFARFYVHTGKRKIFFMIESKKHAEAYVRNAV